MKRLFSLILFSILVFSACSQTEKKDEAKTESQSAAKQEAQSEQADKTILARVNGNPIYKEDLNGRRLGGAIRDEILYQEGVKQGLDKKFAKDFENYKKRLVVEAVKKDLLQNIAKQEATDEEIEEQYKKNIDKYTFLSLTEISTGDKNTTEEIRKKLVDGANPNQIAADYTKSGAKVSPANFGFMKKYNDIFEKKEAGQVSKVIEEDGLFKVFVITNVRSIPLLKAKKSLQYNVMAKKRGKIIHDLIEKMKKENNITVEIVKGNEEEGQDETY
ncbi:MAG: hypothetical protein ACRENF_02050 [Thermodesulfobacteriota bacterium]